MDLHGFQSTLLAMTGQTTVHAFMVRTAKVFAWRHQVKLPAGAGELATVACRLQVLKDLSLPLWQHIQLAETGMGCE